jgi:hypothetical protein
LGQVTLYCPTQGGRLPNALDATLPSQKEAETKIIGVPPVPTAT